MQTEPLIGRQGWVWISLWIGSWLLFLLAILGVVTLLSWVF